MQEPSGCTPKKQRRRSLRNLRRQSISAGGEDADASLLLGISTLQGPPPEVDEEYGSLWLELKDFETKRRSKMKGSKRTGRRSSFGITQGGRLALPLWDQPAPYLQQPESVRFAQTTGEASPLMSPAFHVERMDSLRNMHSEEDLHDMSLNTAFSKFSIHSKDVLDELQMRESQNTGNSPSAPYTNPDLGCMDLKDPAHFQSPSSLLCNYLQDHEKTAEDLKVYSPGKMPPEVSGTSDLGMWQREDQNTGDAIQDCGSPKNRSSLLTRLSNEIREISDGLKSSAPNTPPSCDLKAKHASFLSPGGLSTSSTEISPRAFREHKDTDLNRSGMNSSNESEPDVAVNFVSLKLDTSIGSIDEPEQEKSNVDFDLIFFSPCLAPPTDQDKTTKVESPLHSAQPANEHQDTENSPASCSKTLHLSGVDASCSPLAVPLKSSPRYTGRSGSDSGKIESQGLKADDDDNDDDEGKTVELTTSIMHGRPKQLRRTRRVVDLTLVPEIADIPLPDGIQADGEETPAGIQDSSAQSPGTRRRILVRGKRRSGSIVPLPEKIDDKSVESTGSEILQAGLEGNSMPAASSSVTSNPCGSVPPTAAGAGRYQKRKRVSTDLKLVPWKADRDPIQDITMADADRSLHFPQGSARGAVESKSYTDAGFPEMESQTEELNTIEQSNGFADLTGTANINTGKKQQKRKRDLLELLATKDNMDTENPEVDKEMANLNESRARRRKRRSFSIPQGSPPSQSADVTMTDISEESTPVRTGVKRLKSKEMSEKELEDLYKNKNYKLPELRLWETIFETPEDQEEGSNEAEQLMSKRRYKRVITFSENDPVKVKKRMRKAVKKGWTLRKKIKVTNDDVQEKLDRLEASMNRADDIW